MDYEYMVGFNTDNMSSGEIVAMWILMIFSIICLWKVFTKAGKPGWAVLVPFYNIWVLFEIMGYNGALSLLILIPVLGWLAVYILMIVGFFNMAKYFGKSAAFGVGLWLINIVFVAILAFDDSTYTKH